MPVQITDDPIGALREPAERLSARLGTEVTAGALVDSPHINTVEGFIEEFRRLRDELGISSFMVGAVGELDPSVERLDGT